MTKKTILILLIAVGIILLSITLYINEAESAKTYESLQLFEIENYASIYPAGNYEMIFLTENDIETYSAFQYLLEDVGYKRTMPITDHPLGDLFYIHKCIDTQTVNEMMKLFGSNDTSTRILFYNETYYKLTILNSGHNPLIRNTQIQVTNEDKLQKYNIIKTYGPPADEILVYETMIWKGTLLDESKNDLWDKTALIYPEINRHGWEFTDHGYINIYVSETNPPNVTQMDEIYHLWNTSAGNDGITSLPLQFIEGPSAYFVISPDGAFYMIYDTV